MTRRFINMTVPQFFVCWMYTYGLPLTTYLSRCCHLPLCVSLTHLFSAFRNFLQDIFTYSWCLCSSLSAYILFSPFSFHHFTWFMSTMYSVHQSYYQPRKYPSDALRSSCGLAGVLKGIFIFIPFIISFPFIIFFPLSVFSTIALFDLVSFILALRSYCIF